MVISENEIGKKLVNENLNVSLNDANFVWLMNEESGCDNLLTSLLGLDGEIHINIVIIHKNDHKNDKMRSFQGAFGAIGLLKLNKFKTNRVAMYDNYFIDMVQLSGDTQVEFNELLKKIYFGGVFGFLIATKKNLSIKNVANTSREFIKNITQHKIRNDFWLHESDYSIGLFGLDHNNGKYVLFKINEQSFILPQVKDTYSLQDRISTYGFYFCNLLSFRKELGGKTYI